MSILGLEASAREAAKRFRTFTTGKPDIISVGIPAVDKSIGGLFPGSAGVLGAATGVGKSSIILSSALDNPTQKVGVISLEDTPDVWGARALAHASGVDSRRIRTKDFLPSEVDDLKRGLEKLESVDHIHIAYSIAGSLESILKAIDELAYEGCRLIWVDYLQKVRGVSDDRRNEVGRVYVEIQRRCAELGVAVMFVSQFRRILDPSKTPSINWLKESGDIENEARLIILFQKDPSNPKDVIGRMAKSTNGGEGTPIRYRRDGSGTLRFIEFDQEGY